MRNNYVLVFSSLNLSSYLGIRSMDVTEKEHLNAEKCFFAEDIYGNNKWMEKSIDLMTDNVYLTIDLDAFDPSIMPSTGTPEPGGLNWNDTIFKVFDFSFINVYTDNIYSYFREACACYKTYVSASYYCYFHN